MRYTVLGTYDVRYTIEAETADDAADLVQQGEAGNGEIEGASIETVTSKEYDHYLTWDQYQDERSHCTCGHLMDQHFSTGSVTADDGSSVPVTPCRMYLCKCLTPTLATAVTLPAEDVPS